jgi:hypothetical protein
MSIFPTSDIFPSDPNSTTTTIGNLQKLYEWDSDSLPLYIGESEQGTSTLSTAWTIKKIVWASGLPTSIKTSTIGAWNDRTSLTYS